MKGFILGLGLGLAMGCAGMYLFIVGKRAQSEENDIPEKESKGTKATANNEPPVIMNNIAKQKSEKTPVDYTKFSENMDPKKAEAIFKELRDNLKTQSDDEDPHNDVPEIIPPDEFQKDESYDAITFTYFNGDGVLVDDGGDPISSKDAAMLLGDDALNHFGEYDDFAVYVKNNLHGAYYEIILDDRRYSDFAKSKPRPVEIE